MESTNEETLIKAVLNEDVGKVRKLLDTGQSFNHVNQDNKNILHLMILSKDMDGKGKCKFQKELDRQSIVYMISDAGVNFELTDKNNKTCLESAVDHMDVSMCEILLQCGADMFAETMDGISIFDKVLDLGKSSDDKNIKKIVKIFQSYQPGLWKAVESNSINDVRRLINLWCKTDLTKNNKTLQELAIETGNEEIIGLIFSIHPTMKLIHHVLASDIKKVKYLMETSPNNLLLDLRNMSHNGAPILYFVLQQKDAEMVKLFIENGCHIYTIMRDNEGCDMPVFFAALKHDVSVQIIKALLPHCKPLQEELLSRLLYKGKTVLEIALEENVSLEVFNLLIDRSGAVLISKRNMFNETVRDLALKSNKINFVDVIDSNVALWILEPKTYPNQRQILALHGYQPLLEVKCQNGNKIVEYLSNDEFIKQLINYQNQIQLLAEAVEKGDSVAFNNLCVLPNNDIFNCCLSWEGRVVGDYLPLLHRAVLFNHPHLVKAILMLKSPHQSIDTLFDQHNRTALHYAYAIPEADEIRKLLLNSGCSEHVLDKNGKEPLDFSDKACTKTMNKLLKRLKNKVSRLVNNFLIFK